MPDGEMRRPPQLWEQRLARTTSILGVGISSSGDATAIVPPTPPPGAGGGVEPAPVLPAPGVFKTPSTPTLSGTVQGIRVSWNGLNSDGDPYPTGAYVEVHISTTGATFTPDATTLAGTLLGSAGFFTIGALTAGTTYYVRLVGVDEAGNKTSPSTAASSQTGLTTTSDYGTATIGAGAVSFNARQIGGVTSTVGTATPTSPVVGDIWLDTTGGATTHKRWNGTAWETTLFGVGSIADNAITEVKIDTAAITAAKIAAGAITEVKIDTAAVTAAKLAGSAVTEVKIDTAAVTSAKLAGSAVTEVKIASDAITAPKIAAGAVEATKIAASAVTAEKIAASAVEADKIAANAVTAAKISAGSVETAKLAAGAVTAEKIAASAVEADKIAANAVTAVKITAGAVETAKLATGAITAEKISAGAVETDKLAANAVTAAKIAANTITASQIAASTITSSQIAASTITSTNLAAGAVTAGAIAAGAVTTAKLDAGAVTADKIAAATITGDKIAANTIDATKISAAFITASDVNGNVTSISGGVITSGTISGRTVQSSSGAARIVLNNADTLDFYSSNVKRGDIYGVTVSGLNGLGITGALDVSSTIFGQGISISTSTADFIGVYNNNTTGLDNVGITTAGRLRRLSSSQAIKYDIATLTAPLSPTVDDAKVCDVVTVNPTAILDVAVTEFSVIDDGEATDRRVLGFIAEDVADKLPIAVSRDANGDPAGVLDTSLLAALLAVVQDQQQTIADLTARIEALEA